MKKPEDTLSAAQAAERLGVKRATLYTYASRGWLRSTGSGRGRRYVAADVDELAARSAAGRGHAAAAAWAMRFGPPVLESSICSIRPSGPWYRAQSALRLAQSGASFERVAELLWTGALPPEARWDGCDWGFDPSAFAALADGSVARVLRVAAAALPPEDDPLRWGRCAIRRLAAAGARAFPGDWASRAAAALGAGSIAEAVLAAVGAAPTSAVVAAVDRALVLCADHELNASAFAARVAAGTGADAGAFLCAAIGAWSGANHGTAGERIEQGVADGTFPAVAFGQPLYPDGDPRATALLADARALGALGPMEPWLARAAEAGRAPPNVDVGLVALATAAGLPGDAARLVFAVGRCAGWLAHGWEQRASGQLLRPRAQTR